MKDNSSSGDTNNLVKQFLYSESENTNTDKSEVLEIDANGNKHLENKAGAGPNIRNKINDHYQSEGVNKIK
ncbi:hypothetical protein CHF27_008820 [Romboutsia maritimum]|uniref:Uncharacterized protein n=1 Tax=Romboutsia maritimum TaxID=2020948 RepID=A0A371IS95_9FIRM|nr:hypothetical protein [Romboutsia maritimum]RDY23339.1 hypothetical protein CHF27_008820 [Romboutsia maritimum]